MAFSFTVEGVEVVGSHRKVWGTFTSATGDTTASLTASTHGLNHIIEEDMSLQEGGVNIGRPKITVSSGTITAVWDDTLGYSGKWKVIGK